MSFTSAWYSGAFNTDEVWYSVCMGGTVWMMSLHAPLLAQENGVNFGVVVLNPDIIWDHWCHVMEAASIGNNWTNDNVQGVMLAGTNIVIFNMQVTGIVAFFFFIFELITVK